MSLGVDSEILKDLCHFKLGPSCLIGTWEIRILGTVQTMKAWCVRFQKEVKPLSEHLCEDSEESVVKPLCYWGT